MGKCTVLYLILWIFEYLPVLSLLFYLANGNNQYRWMAQPEGTKRAGCNVNMSPTDVTPIVVPLIMRLLYDPMPSYMIHPIKNDYSYTYIHGTQDPRDLVWGHIWRGQKLSSGGRGIHEQSI